jgi:hypothetical protein
VQLEALKNLLLKFSETTGLKVNYDKSCMLPINISEEEVRVLAYGFGCTVGSFPFTYLGLPMGTTRPTIQDLTPIVDIVERKLNASSTFLAYGGRLQLVTSCLQSMFIYALYSLSISLGIIKPINRILKHGLWGKKNSTDRKQSLARWDIVCKPKESGGLGIVDLQKKNEALLMKQIHKFYNKEDIPWVKLVWNYYQDEVPHVAKLCGSFWWKDILKLADMYREVCPIFLGSGDTTLFWTSKCRDGTLQEDFPDSAHLL